MSLYKTNICPLFNFLALFQCASAKVERENSTSNPYMIILQQNNKEKCRIRHKSHVWEKAERKKTREWEMAEDESVHLP
jgi:hypothetical protein